MAAKTYDPDKTYDVQVSGVIDLGAMKLRPMHSYKILGSMLATLPKDKIASATPTPDVAG